MKAGALADLVGLGRGPVEADVVDDEGAHFAVERVLVLGALAALEVVAARVDDELRGVDLVDRARVDRADAAEAHDVGGLEDRVGQQARPHRLLAVGLGLELGHLVQPRQGRGAGQDPGELRMGPDLGLDEDGAGSWYFDHYVCDAISL